MTDRLGRYHEMRDFSRTPEPRGATKRKNSGALHYYIQRHDATRLHYDFRLELDGVLKSWAVPKGPSLDPADKRLAVQTEDHPLDYGEFEGVIPEKQYGAGDVLLWDKGVWQSEDADPEAALRRGTLHFRLDGQKLHGRWVLSRMKDQKNWLLIKRHDDEVRTDFDIVEERPESVKRAPKKSRRAAKTPPETTIRISHPDRLIWPSLKISKADLARYYTGVAEWMLPHVANRPLTLVRCPDGAEAKCFYQRHLGMGASPGDLKTFDRLRSAKGKYLYLDSKNGILSAVQNGAVEFHTWGASVPDARHPDRITMDLDPGPGVKWSELVRATRLTRTLLEKLGLKCFLKTTGGKGLHVVAPLEPRLEWDKVKEFTRLVAEFLVKAEPGLFVAKMSKAKRTGKVFVDYLRNSETASAVSAYSARARKEAGVSTPLEWDELGRADIRGKFTVKTVPKRLARLTLDPWAEYRSTRQSITEAAWRALET